MLFCKLKGGLYKTCVRSVTCYRDECLAMEAADVRRIQTTEMSMIRMMCSRTLPDKIANSVLRERTGVEDIHE